MAVATTPGALTALVEVLRKQTYYGALEAVCYAVARIVRGNEANQNAWAAEGALTDLLSQSRSKSSDVQTAALEAITCVAQNNPNIQEAIIGYDCNFCTALITVSILYTSTSIFVHYHEYILSVVRGTLAPRGQ